MSQKVCELETLLLQANATNANLSVMLKYECFETNFNRKAEEHVYNSSSEMQKHVTIISNLENDIRTHKDTIAQEQRALNDAKQLFQRKVEDYVILKSTVYIVC